MGAADMDEGDGWIYGCAGLLGVLLAIGLAWQLGLLALPVPPSTITYAPVTAPCTVRGQVLYLNGEPAVNSTVLVTNATANLTQAVVGRDGLYAASFLANASASCPPVHVALLYPAYATPVDVDLWFGRTAWVNLTATSGV